MTDPVDVLWAPWRGTYVRAPRAETCFLCEAAVAPEGDAARFVVWRSRRTFVVLNTFPYNTGHLMVAPYRHVGEVEALDGEEQADLMAALGASIAALRRALHPDGFNVGLNLGRVAGAGLEGHLHVHVVPRWQGDTNFLPVLGAVKVVPDHLEVTYRQLRATFAGSPPRP
ncbi:MAG: HIT domain-containing protein [Armatimonadota bacterium]|nr:HIT domain-containing protein [Armatimonadota bacterium]